MGLLQNAIYIPDKDLFLKSEHTHDYVCHEFDDGETICIDGGLDYAKRGGDFEKIDGRYEEYCLASDGTFEGHITDRLLWGTRGKDGNSPLEYRTIKELAHRPDGLNHMKAILANCLNIAPMHKRVVEYWVDKLSKIDVNNIRLADSPLPRNDLDLDLGKQE